jgi:hypothetical protein
MNKKRIGGTGFEVNPESWTQLKGSNEKRIQSRRKTICNQFSISRPVCPFCVRQVTFRSSSALGIRGTGF